VASVSSGGQRRKSCQSRGRPFPYRLDRRPCGSRRRCRPIFARRARSRPRIGTQQIEHAW
jgi:hypothetical protein